MFPAQPVIVSDMPCLTDLWGNTLEVTPSFVAHRNRLIDVHLIHTFHAKGRKLLINTFKQNDHIPTMCIFFDNKEKAQEAYEVMKQVYYGGKPAVVTQESDFRSDMAYALFIAFLVIPVMTALSYAMK